MIDKDADGGVTAPDFIGFPSANGNIQTTLDITGQIPGGGGGNAMRPNSGSITSRKASVTSCTVAMRQRIENQQKVLYVLAELALR